MSQEIFLDLAKFADYSKQSQKEFSEMQFRQEQIGKEFTRLGNNWQDAIYYDTGKVLHDVEKKIEDTYTGLKSSIYAMVDYHNRMCQYNRCLYLKLDCRMADFNGAIKEGTMSITVVKTDPEALKIFSKKLTEYINETDRAFKKIKERHEGMHRYWRSPQYNQFKNVLDSVESDLKKQLLLLSQCSDQIMEQYEILRGIQETNINKKYN